MFAKNVKNGRDAGKNRSGRSARPVSLPSFMRPDPDGKLVAMYNRIKTASSKPKLSTGRDRYERVKSQPVTDEYDHIRSPVADYIRRPFLSTISKPMACDGSWRDAPPADTTMDASTQDLGKVVCEGVGKEFLGEVEDREDFDGELPNYYKFRCKKADVDSVFTAGLAEVQRCKTTVAVFERYAETFHDILERCTYAANTADAATQTLSPKLRRTQTNLVYAGFWESCTWRQNCGMQTEEPNLTFAKQPTGMLLQNSSGTKKLFGWKSFGLAFFVSAVFLGLMEIPNLF